MKKQTENMVNLYLLVAFLLLAFFICTRNYSEKITELELIIEDQQTNTTFELYKLKENDKELERALILSELKTFN